MTTRSATAAAVAALLVGCGTDPTGEIVVDHAGKGTLVGASGSAVYWTVADGGGARVMGSSLASLPAEPQELATATGAVVLGNDRVLFASGSFLMRAQIDGPAARAASTAADALAETPGPEPRLVWTLADKLSWGMIEAERTVVMVRTTRVDHVRATARRIYAAVDGTNERRLVAVDLDGGVIHNLASSSGFAEAFPSAADGATYRGRIVGADDDGAYWLVEESPSRRAVLIALPERGESMVVLDTIQNATGFFVTADAFYWQEGDALLTAPKSGGAASIATDVHGTAGAIADGFVYYVTPGGSIERLAL